ncbi:hypothetical protein K227x_23350 [Rubripirellula lacrimiformis]|uniref:Uncharacterized protein n=1 Tax=Rubripirellula lacrimiformis TaxID=1930273 RepID=A0A517N9Y2_9BACT|nr:hypothetical protein [Rubripirellula lacrimiformis]QDT03949.1 hypothetical protein K227x_23350 [Rubripirellula lacrimiformis]
MHEANDRFVHAVAGAMLGSIAGGGVGIASGLIYPGWTVMLFVGFVLAGGLGCSLLGYFKGDAFTDWIRDNLWKFW